LPPNYVLVVDRSGPALVDAKQRSRRQQHRPGHGNFGRRQQNVVQYWTPTLGGFSARLAASANEGKTWIANRREVPAFFGWAGGGHSLSVSWEKHYDQLGNTVTPKVDEEGLMGVGSVTFGKTELGFIVRRIEKNRTKQKSYYERGSRVLRSECRRGDVRAIEGWRPAVGRRAARD